MSECDGIKDFFFTELVFKKYFSAFNSSITKKVLLPWLCILVQQYPRNIFSSCNNDNQKHSTEVTLKGLITYEKL